VFAVVLKALGRVAVRGAYAVGVVLTGWALVLDVTFLIDRLGWMLGIVSLVAFPVTLVAAPIWAAVVGWLDPLMVAAAGAVVWSAGFTLGARYEEGPSR